MQIFLEVFEGYADISSGFDVFEVVAKITKKAEGVDSLLECLGTKPRSYHSAKEQVTILLKSSDDIPLIISVIELMFRTVNMSINYLPSEWFDRHTNPEDAIKELNLRMKDANLGYEFIDGYIIPINSKELHKKVVKPSLFLLSSEELYKGSDDEYREAFSFYKTAKYAQVLIECNKAIESCLKAICTKRSWVIKGKANTGNLITVCKDKGLFPSLTSNHLTNLISLTKSVSAIRGDSAGHGQGTEIRKVPKELASYVLHLTATNIIFLIESERVMK